MDLLSIQIFILTTKALSELHKEVTKFTETHFYPRPSSKHSSNLTPKKALPQRPVDRSETIELGSFQGD